MTENYKAFVTSLVGIQFLAMTFAQVTYRQSLADIEVCLRSRQDQPTGWILLIVAHSTLADAKSVA